MNTNRIFKNFLLISAKWGPCQVVESVILFPSSGDGGLAYIKASLCILSDLNYPTLTNKGETVTGVNLFHSSVI
jgi:hypothetical protein